MQHVLDNPAWNAMISGNKGLAAVSGQIAWFDGTISPFVGLQEPSEENFSQLYKLLPDQQPALYVGTQTMTFPDSWKVIFYASGLQMVCESPATQGDPAQLPIPLTTTHVEQMLALTKLTNPGPFATRTIEFGHYHGFFENGELVAMAGQRMRPLHYAEISAVCTHPDHTGKGYARSLLQHQLQRMAAAGYTPFLHVRDDNERAIKVYESLGFAVRTPVHFYLLERI